MLIKNAKNYLREGDIVECHNHVFYRVTYVNLDGRKYLRYLNNSGWLNPASYDEDLQLNRHEGYPPYTREAFSIINIYRPLIQYSYTSRSSICLLPSLDLRTMVLTDCISIYQWLNNQKTNSFINLKYYV